MWELWMNLNYGHLYIPLPSNKANSSQKATFFWWKKTTVVWAKIFREKKLTASKWKETYLAIRKILQNFQGHDHWHCRYINFVQSFTFFQRGCDNVVEIWAFDATSRVYFRPLLRSILHLTIEHCRLLRKLYKALFWCKKLRIGIE